MDPNLSISGQTPQEDSQQTKEINLNFPNLSRINVLLLETKISEEDDAVEKSYSPSKYFGKRPSFEYKNLIKIERTTQRALSAVQKKLDETEKTPPNKAYDEESSSQQELENSKVHFSAHILEEEKDVISSPSINSKIVKKPKKSILKKSNYNEDINIDKIFIQDINQDYIDKLLLESGKEGKHFSEKITKSFVDYWKSLSHEHGIRFLQVFIINY